MDLQAVLRRHQIATCLGSCYVIVWASGLLAFWLNPTLKEALLWAHAFTTLVVMLLGPSFLALVIIALKKRNYRRQEKPSHLARWLGLVRVYASALLLLPFLIVDGFMTIAAAIAPEYQIDGLYERAVHRSRMYKIWAALHGRSTRLLDLTSVTAQGTIAQAHSIGVTVVSLRQIRGSEGRCCDFDDVFHPLRYNSASRWGKLARLLLQGASLPPVELIRVGDVYYVRDGHHRISIARTLGQKEIDADVTVWQIESTLT